MIDELSLGLAPKIVEQLMTLLRDLNAKGQTILLVEQNAERALTLADKAYVLESGRVVLSGTGAELLGNKEVADAYFGT